MGLFASINSVHVGLLRFLKHIRTLIKLFKSLKLKKLFMEVKLDMEKLANLRTIFFSDQETSLKIFRAQLFVNIKYPPCPTNIALSTLQLIVAPLSLDCLDSFLQNFIGKKFRTTTLFNFLDGNLFLVDSFFFRYNFLKSQTVCFLRFGKSV